MRYWLWRALILGALLYLVGIAVVELSGHGGNRTGGSELVWRVGGVMVYASFAVLLVTLALGVSIAIRSAMVHLRRRIEIRTSCSNPR